MSLLINNGTSSVSGAAGTPSSTTLTLKATDTYYGRLKSQQIGTMTVVSPSTGTAAATVTVPVYRAAAGLYKSANGSATKSSSELTGQTFTFETNASKITVTASGAASSVTLKSGTTTITSGSTVPGDLGKYDKYTVTVTYSLSANTSTSETQTSTISLALVGASSSDSGTYTYTITQAAAGVELTVKDSTNTTVVTEIVLDADANSSETVKVNSNTTWTASIS